MRVVYFQNFVLMCAAMCRRAAAVPEPTVAPSRGKHRKKISVDVQTNAGSGSKDPIKVASFIGLTQKYLTILNSCPP